MTAFTGFPRDGYAFSANDVGRALAGLVRREASGLPRVGMLGVGPVVTAVPASWKVQVGVFAYVHLIAGAIQFSGLSTAEQVDIVPAVGDIPAGQARIDLVCWDPVAAALAVVKGNPAATPVEPSAGGLAPVKTVRVNASDGMVIAGQLATAFQTTGVVTSDPPFAKGTVAKRVVAPSTVTNVPVTFPVGVFDVAPNVQATGWGDARDCSVFVDNVTATGCIIRLGSVATQNRTIGAMWRAEAA